MNLEFSPNNKFITSRSSQRELDTSPPTKLSRYKVTILIWDIATGALQQTISYKSYFKSTNQRFLPDCRRLATWSQGPSLCIWDIATGARLQQLEAVPTNGTSLAFSPDGRLLVFGSADSRLHLWDIAALFSEKDVERRFPEYIERLEVSSNGRFLASLMLDGQFQLWDATAGTLLRTFETNRKVNVVAFSSDGRILAGGCTDAIWLWDTITYSLQRIISTLEGILTWSLISYGRKGGKPVPRLNICDVSTDALGRTKTRPTPMKALAFSPDNRLLASISADLKLQLSNVADTCSHTQPGMVSSNSVETSDSMASHALENHWHISDLLRSSRPMSLAFSADSRLLACLMEDSISVWDTGTKSLRLTASAPEGVVSLAFSEDGSLLKTNMGSFKIQSGSDEYCLPLFPPLSLSFSAAPDQIYVHQDEWIHYGKHAIWLPLEYQAPRLWKVSGKTLALGGIESGPGGILTMSFV